MRGVCRVLTFALLMACGRAPAPSSVLIAAQEQDWTPIERSHRKRLETIQSVQLAWEGEHTILNNERTSTRFRVPSEPVTMPSAGELVFDHESQWMKTISDKWDLSQGEVIEGRVTISTFHHGKAKTYNSNSGRGRVDVRSLAATRWASNFLTLSIRPNPPYLNRVQFRIYGVVDTSNGERLLISNKDIDRHPSRAGASVDYYLDPKRDYIVTRIERLVPGGDLNLRADISYQEHPAAGFIPTDLSVIKYNSAQPQIVTRMESVSVTRIDINEAIDTSLFEFEFPEGTTITGGSLPIAMRN